MLCPNCEQPFHYTNLDGQHILHCGNCGVSFFEENSINRISVSSAKILADDKQNDEILGQEKHCPKDKTVLQTMKSDSIPDNITLLSCKQCRGVFAFADDLLRFKQAQTTKISYFKLWNKPLPSLKSVLVLSLILFLSVTAFSLSNRVGNRVTNQIQADEMVSRVNFLVSGRFLFISFKTNVPFTSAIVIADRETNTKTTLIINKIPSTLHVLTIDNTYSQGVFSYQLILTDEKNKAVVTKEKPLQISH